MVVLSDLWIKAIGLPGVILERKYPPRGCPFEGNLLHQYTALILCFNGLKLGLFGGWIKYGDKSFGLSLEHVAYNYHRWQTLTEQQAQELAGRCLIKDYKQDGEENIELLVQQIMDTK